MEEKIQEILDNYDELIERLELKEKSLEAQIKYYHKHNFMEEKRILQVKLDAISLSVYRWRKMHTEIQDILNAWNS